MEDQDNSRAIDSIDIASQLEEQHRNSSIAAALSQSNPVDRNSDMYGICLDCEIEIPAERLEAVQATRCICCQTDHESIQARYAK